MSLETFSRHFRRTFPDLVGRRLLVALSGGGDSVALLHLLRDPDLGLSLEAAHVHHGVRGTEADADAAFCRDLCEGLGIPFHLLRLPPVPRGAGSREAWWRERRYALLQALREETGTAAVATGHQRDDVVEGVLVQLLRGGGPRAMAGIAGETASGDIRPLLPWSRAEIRRWLAARGIAWREDSSNADPDQLRARVRKSILPALEDASPAVRRHLRRLAADLSASEAAFAAILRAHDAWIDPFSPAGVPVDEIAAFPAALRTRWLHAQAARAGIGPVTRRQTALLDGLLDRGEPRGITLAGRWRLLRAAGCLWLEPPGRIPAWDVPFPDGARIDLPLPGWSAGPPEAGDRPPSPWRAALPPGRLRLRSARAGDRYRGRRLASLLERYPRHLRRTWPVVTLGDTIVWVPGIEVIAHPAGAANVEVIHP